MSMSPPRRLGPEVKTGPFRSGYESRTTDSPWSLSAPLDAIVECVKDIVMLGGRFGGVRSAAGTVRPARSVGDDTPRVHLTSSGNGSVARRRRHERNPQCPEAMPAMAGRSSNDALPRRNR